MVPTHLFWGLWKPETRVDMLNHDGSGKERNFGSGHRLSDQVEKLKFKCLQHLACKDNLPQLSSLLSLCLSLGVHQTPFWSIDWVVCLSYVVMTSLKAGTVSHSSVHFHCITCVAHRRCSLNIGWMAQWVFNPGLGWGTRAIVWLSHSFRGQNLTWEKPEFIQ